jgi:hypothetical protein
LSKLDVHVNINRFVFTIYGQKKHKVNINNVKGKGWAPTLIGYSMQGLCKFGFYEVFKIFYGDLIGEVSKVCVIPQLKIPPNPQRA